MKPDAQTVQASPSHPVEQLHVPLAVRPELHEPCPEHAVSAPPGHSVRGARARATGTAVGAGCYISCRALPSSAQHFKNATVPWSQSAPNRPAEHSSQRSPFHLLSQLHLPMVSSHKPRLLQIRFIVSLGHSGWRRAVARPRAPPAGWLQASSHVGVGSRRVGLRMHATGEGATGEPVQLRSRLIVYVLNPFSHGPSTHSTSADVQMATWRGKEQLRWARHREHPRVGRQPQRAPPSPRGFTHGMRIGWAR